jgi:hypothetical protein
MFVSVIDVAYACHGGGDHVTSGIINNFLIPISLPLAEEG